jgi:hypothetical protein
MRGETNNMALMKFEYDGDELDVVHHDGGYWVVLARLCESLDLNVQAQTRKLLRLRWARVAIIAAHDSTGREQKLFCLHLESMAGWLFSINGGKINSVLRAKLLRYQRECAQVLADHFLGKRGQTPARRMPKAERRARLVLRLVKGLSPASVEQRDALLVAAAEWLLPCRDGPFLEAPRPLSRVLDLSTLVDNVPEPVPPPPGSAEQKADTAIEGWSLRGLLERFEQAGMSA